MPYHSNSSFIHYSMYLLVSMCGERNSHEREKGNRRAKFEFRPRQLHSLSHKCHRENHKAITSSLSYGLNSCIEWALSGSVFKRISMLNSKPWMSQRRTTFLSLPRTTGNSQMKRRIVQSRDWLRPVENGQENYGFNRCVKNNKIREVFLTAIYLYDFFYFNFIAYVGGIFVS